MNTLSPSKQWARFLSRFDSDIVLLARGALTRVRRQVPGAMELVYDNFNALVIGFGPSERASEAVFSLAIYPRWVNLFFLQGAKLHDPARMLKGAGRVVRHIRLSDARILGEPAVRDLMTRALAQAPVPIAPGSRRRMVIRAVSAKQRPRTAAKRTG